MKSAFVLLTVVLFMTACASTPEPEPVQPPAPAPAPAPEPTPKPLAPLPPTPGSVDEFVKTVGERVFFDYNSSQLTQEAIATLGKQAFWLKKYSNVRILIAGNCDERGTREYNLALGARRASAARDFLVNLGIAPSRISTISYGKERPVDPRSNEAGWKINRNAHAGIVSGAVG